MSDGINRRRLLTGSILSLIATAFGFAVRAAVLEDWRVDFNLSQEQIGYLLGAGLFPFAISIILFSLIIDRIGNGVSMAVAFTLHVLSAIVTVAAPFALAPEGSSPEAVAAGQQLGFTLLYIGTFIFALGNGTVEAVVNPVTATLYSHDKTRYLTSQGSEPFEARQEILESKDDEPKRLQVWVTRWGPIVGEDAAGRPLALAWTAHHPQATNLRMLDLESASDVETALRIFGEAVEPVAEKQEWESIESEAQAAMQYFEVDR